ncbi:uncharacterized protein B0H64DRAFT_181096 [Chaetomium fimeti]|uniref:Protein kinase domain-containing protein n=1 Tax=Chaetomium fimeti TaxID=1854472 RepID=A0AAE0LQJ3_9PEZI|nr:hypothetical protein B0H64DRAFT_181096 [Chaetomium fimeti]
MATPRDAPRLTRIRYVGDGLVMSAIFTFDFNGGCFVTVLASPTDEAGGEALVPADYQFDESIEGKILTELTDLTWGTVEEVMTKKKEIKRLEQQLGELVADVCRPTMHRLMHTPIPEAQTLEDYLYPQTYMLQVVTDSAGDNLACRTLDGPGHAGVPELHPPISDERLRGMGLDLEATDIPVVKPPQIILNRRLQGFVWKVTIDGEEMICKVSIDAFEYAIGDELAAYLKIRSARVKLRVPELKGIVQSHRGVIGILLGYIPHKHHNLRALLAETSTAVSSETTTELRYKWAAQIRGTLEELHSLGILWRDIKTDNVLIDENGDAVVLDFGGGNTMGWVDPDKYGTMEGDEQGLLKIMKALEVGI